MGNPWYSVFGQLVASNLHKTFQPLKNEFSLPNNILFWYLQLRHAFNSQFDLTDFELPDNSIPAQMMEWHSKSIISILGNILKEDWEEA